MEQKIRDICQTRMRYGYRPVHVVLRRDGWLINQNKTRGIYRELGMQLRNKTSKRRVWAKLREDCQPAAVANDNWAMDFVHDQLTTGREIRVLTIVDIFSRFSAVVDPRFSFRAEDVVEALERIYEERGYPKTILGDQGSELSPAIRISGPIERGIPSISPGRESPPTTHISRPSMDTSARSA